MDLHRPILIACALGLTMTSALPSQYPRNDDPPARVGRVSFLGGSVSLYPVGAADWAPASLNYPLTADDALWADIGARAEVHLGSSAVRIAPQTLLTFGEVSDTVTQVRLDQGSIDVHVRYLNSNEVYEIDTPAGAVSLADQGHYRIDVTPDGRRTTVTVRDGNAVVILTDRDYPVGPGQSATLIGANRAPIVNAAVGIDDWERWADDRDRREDAAQSTRYVSRDMVGYEDLDEYGTWQVDANYGPIWTPRTVPAGWAPYRYGHWESVQPWGWTWIDDAPWGFAPFHYGRWASVRGRWAWLPGETRVRPVYAPALVAFVGGSNWGVSLSFGGGAAPGGAVGWVPLGPGEPYVPAYRASPAYVQRINVTNVNVARIDVNRLDVNQIRYANRDVPGAVTAVPRNAFERSRPVAPAAVPLRPADVLAARPSAVPLAAGQPVAAPPRGTVPNRGPGRGQSGRDANVPRPPTTAAGQAAPPPPPQWRARSRPGQAPPSVGTPPGQAPPPPDRGRGQQGTPPATPPVTPPPPPPATPPPPPATRRRPTGAVVVRGRRKPRPQRPHRWAATATTGHAATATGHATAAATAARPGPWSSGAAANHATNNPAGDATRHHHADAAAATAARSGPRSPRAAANHATSDPAGDAATATTGHAATATGHATTATARPGAVVVQGPPATTPPAPPPVTPPPPPGRGGPPDTRSNPSTGVSDEIAWQQQRKQLNSRQAQEMADLDRRQQAQLKQTPPGPALVELQKQQQAEKQALAVKQQRERDALDKQHRAPSGN